MNKLIKLVTQKRSPILLIVIFLIIVAGLMSLFLHLSKKTILDSDSSLTDEANYYTYFNERTKLTADTLPAIKLPIEYFAEKNIQHGSVDDENQWNEASLDEMVFQSYPSTTITLLNEKYSNETKSLGDKKSLDEIIKENSKCGENGNEDCGFLDQIEENYSEFKDLAPYYLPYQTIVTDKFDVDGDNQDETIVYSCGVGGNHCPHSVDIIKNQEIIFSAYSSGLRIKETDTNNGFYLEWRSDEDLTGGYCCPWGYMKTRFVYENSQFIPVLEQKVNYLRVIDSNSQ